PNKNANSGTLTVGENANLYGDVYLFVTAGSTAWPVEVSIVAAALKDGSTVTTGNVPAGYVVEIDENGTWGVTSGLKGSGTETDPYLIRSVADLVFFRNSVNAGEEKYNKSGVYVALAADIDLAGENWVGIGSATAEHGFMGNFDGKTYKIKNLTINNPTLDSDGYAYAGFFGVTEGTDKAQNVIKNLTIENVTINTTGHIVAAAIAYPYYTIVENVTVCGNIAIKGGDYTAGVLGYTRRCVNASGLTITGNTGSYITGKKTVGGVISDLQMNGGLTANYRNFTAEGLTITGEMHVGGISGIIANQTLNGATVKNVKLACSDARVGTVSGSLGGTSTISDVTVENVTGATAIIGATFKEGAAVEAKIGNTYYATFADALAAAKTGETVTLLAPITVAAGETLEIDLAGRTIEYASAVVGEDMITNYGTLTINDTVGDGKITYCNTDTTGNNVTVSTITNAPGGELTINGGIIENTSSNDNAFIGKIFPFAIDNVTNGTLGTAKTTINGGVIDSNYRSVRQFANSTSDRNTLNINGGKFIGQVWLQSANANAQKATLIINDGTFAPAGNDGSSVYVT
ncbi:MAG: hypothetical protein IKZ06_05105, partial [Oscillospiraceae bacterium]|nr:hypothetical protein [Oscillospiraceae bacterium]